MTFAALEVNSGSFNQTMLDCIEDAVRSILGAQVLESLFVRLQTHDGISRDEIPDRLEVFFPALERAFGQTSGKTIGRFIIKVLYIRLGLTFDGKSNRMPVDYVGDAKRELGLEN